MVLSPDARSFAKIGTAIVTKESLLPYCWMLAGSLAFACMGTLTHALGSSCDWQVIALVRTFLAMIFAAILAVSAGARLVIWKPRTLWIRSIAGSISLVCTFYALTRLPVSDVLTLTNMFPIWVGILSWPLLGQAPSGRVWLSALSGVFGVFLIQQPHFAEASFAVLIALASSFTTAVAMIGLHRLQGIDYRAIVVHFSTVSLLFCILALCLFEHTAEPHYMMDGQVWLMLLGVGASATVGQLMLTKAFAAGAPDKVSVVGLTQIVFVMVMEMILWGRSFDPTTLLGMGLVVAPTAWLMLARF
jgi:drug/metabolite transporter (DMT)-like permease